jgi:pentose-5-phosphate-3-epimerase
MSSIVPAVLPASREDLEEKLARLAALPGVTRVQIDVVDGRFATPASWPYYAGARAELAAMVEKGELLPHLDRIAYEVDLMCLDAERAADAWLALGASRLTFHFESIINPPVFLAGVRAKYGCGAVSCDLVSVGVALNLDTDLARLEPYLGLADYVQLMGIARIGRQGQPFDPRVLERLRLLHGRHPELALQVDGGVSRADAHELAQAGATSLISGSALLRASDPAAAFAELEKLVEG